MPTEELTEKQKMASVKALSEKLDKEHKTENSLVFLNSKKLMLIPCIPTGLPSFDYEALQFGGIPRGRIVELFGGESAGKTTTALHIVAEEQRLGGLAAYVDAEHALDPNYAKALGVNLDRLVFTQPMSGEQALQAVDGLVETGAVSLIVVDSVAALVPEAELAGDIGDSVVYETPVYIRRKGSTAVNIVQIGDLFHKGNATGWYTKTSMLEVLSHKGWVPLLGVQKKKNVKNKPIVYTRTSTGYIGTTKDHSLFINGKEVSPAELSVFDRLDIQTPPTSGTCSVVNEDIAWLLGMYVAEGSTPRTSGCNRFSVCGTDKYRMEKCKTLVLNNFSIKGTVRMVNKAKGNRKALYAMDCPTDTSLGFLMQSCISELSLKKCVPLFILNGTETVKKSFLTGFWEGDGNHSSDGPRKYFNTSWPAIAGIQYLNSSLGIQTNVVVTKEREWQLTLSEAPKRLQNHPAEIRAFYEVKGPEYLYDISTKAGTFVCALGNIVCHNSHMGLQARMMAQAMRILVGKCSKNMVSLVFLNQVREKIGVMYGNPETTTGGRALKFAASSRIKVRRGEAIWEGTKENIVGHKLIMRIEKNKGGIPFRTAELDLLYPGAGRQPGFDKVADTIAYAAKHGLFESKGSWYWMDGERIANGLDNLKETLRNSPEVITKLQKKIKEYVKTLAEEPVGSTPALPMEKL
jgi:RecA/RadA recombinase